MHGMDAGRRRISSEAIHGIDALWPDSGLSREIGAKMDIARLELADGSEVFIPVLVRDPEEEVGLHDLHMKAKDLLLGVRPLVEQLRAQLSNLTPDKTTVKFSVGVGWEAGKLVSIIGGPTADFGIEVSVEWSREDKSDLAATP
jgi:hypothetical protein